MAESGAWKVWMNRKMSNHFYAKSDDAPKAPRFIENIFTAVEFRLPPKISCCSCSSLHCERREIFFRFCCWRHHLTQFPSERGEKPIFKARVALLTCNFSPQRRMKIDARSFKATFFFNGEIIYTKVYVNSTKGKSNSLSLRRHVRACRA